MRNVPKTLLDTEHHKQTSRAQLSTIFWNKNVCDDNGSIRRHSLLCQF